MPTSRGLRRTTTAIVGAALLASLSACSVTEADEADAAQQAAADYADLIATAEGEDLETLWATTVTEEPALVRDAGRMLAGATERIEVLGVGEAEPAPGAAQAPYESDLDTQEARQVVIDYRLSGTDYESAVVLAPHEGGPRSEPASWAVLSPLLGTLTVPAVGLGAVVLDTYISEVHAQVGDDYSEQGLPLYPAVYELQQRADPYFTSTPVDLTISAGEAAQLPQFDVVGSEETVQVLTDQLVHTLQTCADEPGACSPSTYDLVQNTGVQSAPEDWSIEVTTVPDLTLEGSDVAFSAGTLVLHDPDGSETEIAFKGTSPWTLDAYTREPTLLGYAMDIQEVQR